MQNILEPQPKVSQINVVRNENTLLEEYYRANLETERLVELPAGTTTELTFKVPFFGIGKFNCILRHNGIELPSQFLEIQDTVIEEKGEDGYTTVTIEVNNTTEDHDFYVDRTTTCDFYKVTNTKFEEVESLSGDTSGEAYINDNFLITNGHTANKAKQVAKFMNDASDQYEIDVIQNFLYEIGDPIRVETQKNIFKTCVITGLQFVLPGSSGHVTCRRIFSIDGISEAVIGLNGVIIQYNEGAVVINAGLLANGETFVLGFYDDYSTAKQRLVIVGGHDKYASNGASTVYITDKNGHIWEVLSVERNASGSEPTDLPYIEIPAYGSRPPINNSIAYGAIALITKMYEEQGMTSPVNYDCSYTII